MITDEKLMQMVQELEPVIGSKAQKLWHGYLIARTPARKDAWRRKIKIMAERLLKCFQDNPRLPPPENTNGHFELGKVIYPDRPYADFGLNEPEFCRHILITGMTGTGKTNTTLQIISQLNNKGVPFLVFDWQREYKKLRKLSQFNQIKVLTIGKESNFRFNPLCPPLGTDVYEWITKLVDVINHAYLGGHGTEYILRDTLVKAYEHVNKSEKMGEYPTFNLVRQFQKKNFHKGRMEWWGQTATRILESLTYKGGLGPVLNYQQKTSLKTLLRENVVVELDRLSHNDKIFFTEALLLWIYEFRKLQGETAELRHALVVEEAHNILSQAKEKRMGGETIMETTLRMIRKFGQSVIAIDQEPSKLSESIKANTNTKITFTLGNGKDIREIAKSMELDRNAEKWLDQLGVGQAIIKVKGRIDRPILVKFPKMDTSSENKTTGRSILRE